MKRNTKTNQTQSRSLNFSRALQQYTTFCGVFPRIPTTLSNSRLFFFFFPPLLFVLSFGYFARMNAVGVGRLRLLAMAARNRAAAATAAQSRCMATIITPQAPSHVSDNPTAVAGAAEATQPEASEQQYAVDDLYVDACVCVWMCVQNCCLLVSLCVCVCGHAMQNKQPVHTAPASHACALVVL